MLGLLSVSVLKFVPVQVPPPSQVIIVESPEVIVVSSASIVVPPAPPLHEFIVQEALQVFGQEPLLEPLSHVSGLSTMLLPQIPPPPGPYVQGSGLPVLLAAGSVQIPIATHLIPSQAVPDTQREVTVLRASSTAKL